MMATALRPFISYLNYKWGEDEIVLVLMCSILPQNYSIMKYKEF